MSKHEEKIVSQRIGSFILRHKNLSLICRDRTSLEGTSASITAGLSTWPLKIILLYSI